MLKAIWMSDPHFTHQGNVIGHDPRQRLQTAVSFINENHSDCEFCIISGDMVNRGTEADYSALRDVLDNLKIPFFPMTGNHDNRNLFRQFLPLPETCMEEFVQYSIETEAGSLICLDTLKDGEDRGLLCQARMSWLRDILEKSGDTPVYLFMHHPPMALGLPMQDTENLQNGGELLDLLTKYPNVKHLFIGHVHRPVTGTVRGIPFATMRSVLYQAPAPKPEWDWNSFAPGREAPNFGLLQISDLGVNLQYLQFCEFCHGTETH